MEHDTKLTAGEVANLWTSYMHDSMCICVFDHYLENVHDEEIKNTLEFAKDLSASHLPKIEEIFNQEEIATPQGFTDKDIYKAPPTLHRCFLSSLPGMYVAKWAYSK